MPFVLVFLLSFLVLFKYAAVRFDSFNTDIYQQAIAKSTYDVIIIPGSPYDSVEQNQMFRARMLWAKSLYERGIARNIIYSGSAVHTPYVEGLVMKIMSDSLGIPSANTYAEVRALHTDENIHYGVPMAKQLGFVTIGVATDPFQSFFLSREVSKWYKDITLIPMPMDTFRMFSDVKVLPKINPEAAMINHFVPLNERDKRQQKSLTNIKAY